MHHSTNLFAGYNELSLFCQNWRPDTTPKGVFVLVPGLGEHSDRYTQLVPSLVEHGYWVYSYDTRGHGRSAGIAAALALARRLYADPQQAIAAMQKARPRIRLRKQQRERLERWFATLPRA